MDNNEILESRSRSFLGMWPVASDYAIRDGYIIEIGDKKEWYLPMGRPELPGEFAKLATGSEEDVLQFVRRYGLLGYCQAFRFPEAISADKMRVYDYNAPGDPLSWVFAHAKAVNLVMQLAKLLNKPAGLKAFMGRLMVERNGRPYISYVLPKRGYHLPSQVEEKIYETEEETARRIIAKILNSNLEGIQREIVVEYVPATEDEGKCVLGFTSSFSFNNLLDCIYWLVADAVTAGKIRACLYCGKPFIAPNDKTKYCPPLQWETVSRCMNRAKQRRFWNEERLAQRRAERRRAQKNNGQ